MKPIIAVIILFALFVAVGIVYENLVPPSAIEWELKDTRTRAETAAIVRAEAQATELAPLATRLSAFWQLWPALVAVAGTLYAGTLGILHVHRVRTERRADAHGLLPVPTRSDAALLASIQALAAYHRERLALASVAPVPEHLVFSPHYSARNDAAALLPGAVATAQLPGPTDLASLNFTPTADRILLGLGEGGDLLTVPAKALCHVALVGATNGGKSNLLRLLIPQLQSIGASVYLADPHYARHDAASGESWAAIEKRLATAPAHEAADMGAMFSLFSHELQTRLQRRRDGLPVGKPMFLALDELPVIAQRVPQSIDMLASLLREGRKCGMYIVGASQTMLVKALGGDSSARDAFRTCFYVGGDGYSATALLDVRRADIDEGSLTTGVAMLRSTATNPARLVRVPYASNVSIDALLGNTPVTYEQAHEQAIDTSGSHVSTAAECATVALGRPQAHTASEQRILALFGSGATLHEVAAAVAGTANPNARLYREARVAVEAVLRSQVSV